MASRTERKIGSARGPAPPLPDRESVTQGDVIGVVLEHRAELRHQAETAGAGAERGADGMERAVVVEARQHRAGAQRVGGGTEAGRVDDAVVGEGAPVVTP